MDKSKLFKSTTQNNHLISPSLWVIGGDFNNINVLTEKKDGIHRLEENSVFF